MDIKISEGFEIQDGSISFGNEAGFIPLNTSSLTCTKATRINRNQGTDQSSCRNNYRNFLKQLINLQEDGFPPPTPPPKNWTKNAQVVFQALKGCLLDTDKKGDFKDKIIKIVNQKIKNQKKKLANDKKEKFHQGNIQHFVQIRDTFVLLLQKEDMPQPWQIIQLITQHLQYDAKLKNRRSLGRQKFRIKNSFEYILSHFKQYNGVPKQQINLIVNNFLKNDGKKKQKVNEDNPSNLKAITKKQINNLDPEPNRHDNQMNQQTPDFHEPVDIQFDELIAAPEAFFIFFVEDQNYQKDSWFDSLQFGLMPTNIKSLQATQMLSQISQK